MSDERYKEGFNKYLHHFGVHPEEDEKWKTNRLKQEAKRLNIALIIPAGVGLFLLSIHYGLITLAYSEQALHLSWLSYALGALLFLLFSLKGKQAFGPMSRQGKSFLKSWRKYTRQRRRESLMLLVGGFPLAFSLINLSYDQKSDTWLKLSVTLLVGLAAAYLTNNYYGRDYDFLIKESSLEKEDTESD